MPVGNGWLIMRRCPGQRLQSLGLDVVVNGKVVQQSVHLGECSDLAL